jgi:hypothetical protein
LCRAPRKKSQERLFLNGHLLKVPTDKKGQEEYWKQGRSKAKWEERETVANTKYTGESIFVLFNDGMKAAKNTAKRNNEAYCVNLKDLKIKTLPKNSSPNEVNTSTSENVSLTEENHDITSDNEENYDNNTTTSNDIGETSAANSEATEEEQSDETTPEETVDVSSLLTAVETTQEPSGETFTPPRRSFRTPIKKEFLLGPWVLQSPTGKKTIKPERRKKDHLNVRQSKRLLGMNPSPSPNEKKTPKFEKKD